MYTNDECQLRQYSEKHNDSQEGGGFPQRMRRRPAWVICGTVTRPIVLCPSLDVFVSTWSMEILAKKLHRHERSNNEWPRPLTSLRGDTFQEALSEKLDVTLRISSAVNRGAGGRTSNIFFYGLWNVMSTVQYIARIESGHCSRRTNLWGRPASYPASLRCL